MDVFDGVKNFLLDNFWRPVANESVYYNPVNTLVYALLFGYAAIKLVFPMLKKLGVTVDRKFVLGITPYVFLGGATRSLKDANIINTFLLETPFIYLLMFALGTGALIAALQLEEYGFEYHKTWGGLGLLLLIISLSLQSFSQFPALLQSLTLFGTISGAFFLSVTYFKPDLSTPEFLLPVMAHFLDGSTSFVAVSTGANEKHVLGQFMIDFMGPLGLLVMKAGIIIPVTYLIFTEYEGERRNYYLLLVATLGFALGTRNLVSMITV